MAEHVEEDSLSMLTDYCQDGYSQRRETKGGTQEHPEHCQLKKVGGGPGASGGQGRQGGGSRDGSGDSDCSQGEGRASGARPPSLCPLAPSLEKGRFGLRLCLRSPTRS